MYNGRYFVSYLKKAGTLDAILALETAPASCKEMGLTLPVIPRCKRAEVIESADKTGCLHIWGPGSEFQSLKEAAK